MKTYFAREKDLVISWRIIDAEGKVLGRVAGKAAELLIGKGNVLYSPNHLVGENVVIINAAKFKVTGKKLDQKLYYHHSMYPGGLKQKTLKKVMETKPEFAIMHAVKGMLPKNKAGRAMLRRLRVYAGTEHQQQAQQPQPVSLD